MPSGTIVDLSGNWMSGLAQLIVDDDEIGLTMIPCDNAPTIRALADMFGDDFITAGHTFDTKKIIGKRIKYTIDSYGLLESVHPYDETDDPMKQEDESYLRR